MPDSSASSHDRMVNSSQEVKCVELIRRPGTPSCQHIFLLRSLQAGMSVRFSNHRALGSMSAACGGREVYVSPRPSSALGPTSFSGKGHVPTFDSSKKVKSEPKAVFSLLCVTEFPELQLRRVNPRCTVRDTQECVPRMLRTEIADNCIT
jgi:hypothetical protein